MNILDFIFPNQCILCSKIGDSICNECIKGLSHTLPSCCICKKLSNMYSTHTECNDIKFHSFTGWYLNKELEKMLEIKKSQEIYSVHTHLIEIVIKYLNIEKLLSSSLIYPLYSSKKKDFKLNTVLANHIDKNHIKESNTIFYVGEKIEKIEKEGLLMEPYQIYFLTLFQTLTPE